VSDLRRALAVDHDLVACLHRRDGAPAVAKRVQCAHCTEQHYAVYVRPDDHTMSFVELIDGARLDREYELARPLEA
jgi:hypothetical protein